MHVARTVDTRHIVLIVHAVQSSAQYSSHYCCCIPHDFFLLILLSADFPIDEDNQQRQQYQLHEHRDGLRQDDLKELQLRKKDPIHRPTSLPSGFIGEPLPVAPQSTQPAPKSLFTAIYQGTVLLVVALIAWRGLRVGTKWIMTHVTPKTRGTRNSGISA